ncbi:MAG: SDR family oxidoreductase [Desulfobacterales bacterium]
MATRTEKRIALVTGANRGIGLEISRQLAELGITVFMGSRSEAAGAEARERLSAKGLDVHMLRLDVADVVSIKSAVTRLSDECGRLDILVNNAGILLDGKTGILELDPVTFQKTVQTNAVGPLLLCQAVIPMMQKTGFGRIVNIASTMGSLNDMAGTDAVSPRLLSPAYRLSKTLLNGITIMVAQATRGSDILVNSACPGWVRSDMGGAEAPLTPAEAADTPVWLATLPEGGPTGGFFRERRRIPW